MFGVSVIIRHKYKVFCVFLLVAVYLYIISVTYSPSDTYFQRTLRYRYYKNFKYILYWTEFFTVKRYLGYGREPFEKCEYKNCFLTDDRNVLPVDRYDAVLFHSRDFYWWLTGTPHSRRPEQKYVFVLQENPYHTRTIESRSIHDFYNWTMTYRKDSDIYFPYGMFIKLPNRKNQASVPSVQQAINKTKLVAWFVSNCHSENNREGVAKDLSKFIPIDIYGACGPLECPRYSKLCSNKLNMEYKFYLSFENAHCVDYISEKVFHTMAWYDVVPIIYGKGDYQKDLPDHSYINVDDYNSPEALANYLKYLDKNVTAYLEYFEYRWHYDINLNMNQKVACDLCKKLFTESHIFTIYENIETWWRSKYPNTCDPILT